MVRQRAADASSLSTRRVTIADVAREAGVSKTTVSVVLNDRAEDLGIREDTRQRVADVAKRLGYIPNYAARALRRQRTNQLAFLIQDVGNPFFVDLAVSVTEAAEASGYTVSVTAAGPPQAELAALYSLHDGSSDAVLIATGRHVSRPKAVAEMRSLVARGIPVVMMLDQSPLPEIPSIRFDVTAAAEGATQHLLRLGHRRIALLALSRGEPIESPSTSQGDRYLGYRKALAEAGIGIDQRLIVRGPDTLAGGREMTLELFGRGAPRPTAALVYNDLMAIGCLRALRESGVRVPEQFALASFDGVELGEFMTPALTSVDQPRFELGRLAVQTVHQLLSGETPSEHDRVLETELVVRESCGAHLQDSRFG